MYFHFMLYFDEKSNTKRLTRNQIPQASSNCPEPEPYPMHINISNLATIAASKEH
jgi:hypothetical protein